MLLHPNTTVSAHTTPTATIITTFTITTAVKAKATTINFTATTTTAAIKTKRIKRKIWNVLKLYGTNSKHTMPRTQVVKGTYEKCIRKG